MPVASCCPGPACLRTVTQSQGGATLTDLAFSSERASVALLERPRGPAAVIPAPVRRPAVSVIIPALNEARNLPHVLGRLPEDIDEVIIVDGHSTDDTVAVARSLRPGVRVVEQTRKGKGNALACGFGAATGDIIVMIDADGSTDPAEIPRFVEALMAGSDFAKGSRFIAGGGSDDITPIRRAGNWFLNALVNVAYRTSYTDLCYGYNAFWRHCLDDMRLDAGDRAEPGEMQWGDGFEIETIINVRVARVGLRIAEVPSFEQPRLHGDSNLSAVRDGLRVLRCIVSERFQARRATPAPAAPLTFAPAARRQS
jgi:glycosyltransferase involved in cell wall biosynthesis